MGAQHGPESAANASAAVVNETDLEDVNLNDNDSDGQASVSPNNDDDTHHHVKQASVEESSNASSPTSGPSLQTNGHINGDIATSVSDQLEEDNPSKPDAETELQPETNPELGSEPDLQSTSASASNNINSDNVEANESIDSPDTTKNESSFTGKEDSVSVTSETPSTSRPALTPTGFRKRSKRSHSIALSIASTSSGQQSIPVIMLVKKAFEKIKSSKDARRITALETAISNAMCKSFYFYFSL